MHPFQLLYLIAFLLMALVPAECAMIGPKRFASTTDNNANANAIRPSLTSSQLEARPWSKTSLTLRSGGYVYHYNNYTVISGDSDEHQPRWTQRTSERAPATAKNKRGFHLAKQALLWSSVLEAENGLHSIRFCYADKAAFKALHCTVEEAANRWNTAPQGRSSIRLDTVKSICKTNPEGNFFSKWKKQDYVVIMHSEKLNGGRSTCGLLPPGANEKGNPKHFVQLGGNVYGDEVKTVATAVHELGHILGLHHEHQRPDAFNHVRLNFEAICGHDKLTEYLEQNIVNCPAGSQISGRITIEQCRRYQELSQLAEIPEIGDMWAGGAWIPTSLDSNGKDVLNEENEFRPMGEFDRESVMLYASDQRGNGVERIHFVPTAAHPVTTIPWPTHPSKGDIAAVARLYPVLASGGGTVIDPLLANAEAVEGLTIEEDES